MKENALHSDMIVDGDSGVRADELLQSRMAQRVTNNRNYRQSKAGSTKQRFVEAAAADMKLRESKDPRARLGIRAICPECAAVYSRTYMRKHRIEGHGVTPKFREPYVEFRVPVIRKRYICPECAGLYPHSGPERIAIHRRKAHGIETPVGVHQHYEKVEWER